MDRVSELKADDYIVPAKQYSSESKIKASRFICTVLYAETKEQAELQLQELKKKYYDANHNCFAWKISETEWRYSDDGEPSGTAGKPIFMAIEGSGLLQVLCVVTRYFGGTKLGTGGLIRAYGESASQALKEAPYTIKTHWENIQIRFDYTFENIIRRALESHHGRIVQSDYSDRVKMQLALPCSLKPLFLKRIYEETNAAAEVLSG